MLVAVPAIRKKHPRLRGEDLQVFPFSIKSLETPPLTRGRRRLSRKREPAVKKHPRLRGEDGRREQVAHLVLETPPLTRGRRECASFPRVQLGNTPAYAGKTARKRKRSPDTWKHPRLRGEDLFSLPRRFFLQETPPLTRGRRYIIGPLGSRQRNTPAYAGKTLQCPRTRSTSQETPPLTRGRPRLLDQETLARRNTPAYAGKTRLLVSVFTVPWKHPRLRGEDHPSGRHHVGRLETPPLTRGRLPRW